MAETFRDIIDLIPRKRRAEFVKIWNRKLPKGDPDKICVADLNMWRHRNSMPGRTWASFEAAAKDFDLEGVTMSRLQAADLESRRQRKRRRSVAGAEAGAAA